MSRKEKIIAMLSGLLGIAVITFFVFFDTTFNGKAWQKVSPEKLGFDSDTFAEMFLDIEANEHKVHGITVMRNQIILWP
ncbi:MAG: hypothetical protein QNJ46_06260 [Leptolyngbyaceae cyanobacterium MO_188.B28]|nr:hypothetical protein [Leptolyngbyaceae cyanobacterium MO_188.B28]